MERASKTGICLGVVLFAFLLAGCAAEKSAGRYREAIDGRVEIPRNEDAVLFCMRQGLSAHYAGDYRTSNLYLRTAEAAAEEGYTQSVSKHGGAFLINDGVLPYGGEDFENALLILFMSLNYVFLGEWNDALVEARKVDTKLNVINDRYAPDQKNIYSADAFIRLVIGVLYDARNEKNDALVSYRLASEAYEKYNTHYNVPFPDILGKNLAALQKSMEQSTASGPGNPSDAAGYDAGYGDIYFLHYNGLCPVKEESTTQIPFSDGYLHKVVVPFFEPRAYSVDHCELHLMSETDGKSYRVVTTVCEIIGGIAIKDLQNRISRLRARAVTRTAIKGIATRLVGELITAFYGSHWGNAIGQGVRSAGVASETADLRSWDNLPDRIDVATIRIPAGNYRVSVTMIDLQGRAIDRLSLPDIAVKAKSTCFKAFRTTQ